MLKVPAGIMVTVTKPHWMMVVNERNEIKWSNFFQTKNGMLDHVCCQFHKYKDTNMSVKIVRCDNSFRKKY